MEMCFPNKEEREKLNGGGGGGELDQYEGRPPHTHTQRKNGDRDKKTMNTSTWFQP